MPPAFVLSQDQTLQTKLLKTASAAVFYLVFQDWILTQILKNLLFFYYDFKILANLKIISRVHRTIQFSKIIFIFFSSLCIKRNRDHNLASIFVLSSDFLNFFKTFFWAPLLSSSFSQTHLWSVWGYNLAPFFVLSSNFFNFFKTFFWAPLLSGSFLNSPAKRMGL